MGGYDPTERYEEGDVQNFLEIKYEEENVVFILAKLKNREKIYYELKDYRAAGTGNIEKWFHPAFEEYMKSKRCFNSIEIVKNNLLGYFQSYKVTKLRIKEMGSRYFFIILYCLLEKSLSRGDYKKR